MSLRYWLVGRKGNYGRCGILAETPEKALQIYQRRNGYIYPDVFAKRFSYSGNRFTLPSGEYVVNMNSPFVGTAENPTGNPPLGWVVMRRAPDRRAYQDEVVRFITAEEAKTLYATRVGGYASEDTAWLGF